MSDLSLALTIKVVDEASKELSKLSGEFQKIGSSWEKVGFAIGASLKVGVTAAVGSLVGLTKAAIDNADEMSKAAQKAGVTTESLSALGYAAKLAGVSNDQLVGGLGKLSKAVVDAQDPTSEMANAFKYLGVETKNVDGSLRKSDEVFKDVATAFSKLPVGISKSAVAMQIFGKSGAELIPLLNSGAAGLEEMRLEAERLGLVISQDLGIASENFNDTLTKLGTGASSVGLSLAQALLPSLQAIATGLLDMLATGDDIENFSNSVAAGFKFIAKTAMIVAFGAVQAAKGLAALFAAGAALLSGDVTLATGIIAQYKQSYDSAGESMFKTIDLMDKSKEAIAAESQARKKAASDLQAQREAELKKLGEYTTLKAKGTAAALAEKEAELKAYQGVVSGLDKEIQGFKELTAEQQIQFNIEHNVIGLRTKSHRDNALTLAREVDQLRMLREQYDALGAAVTQYVGYLSTNVTTNETLKKTYQNLLDQRSKSFTKADIDAASKYNDEVAGVRKTIESLTLQLTAAQQAPGSLFSQVKIDSITAQLTAQQALLDQLRNSKDAIFELIKSQDEYSASIARFLDLIQGQRDEVTNYNKSLKELDQWLKEGSISQEEYRAALRKLGPGFKEVEQFAANAANAAKNSFSDFFFDFMQGKLTNLVTSFKTAIDRMVADALAAKLAESLFGINGVKGSGVLSQAGSFLSGLFRADGGPVTAGQPYIVGERGPEAFIPNISGSIMSNVDTMGALSGGGSNSLTVHINAIDAKSVLAQMDSIKRPLAAMLNGTNRTYNLRTA